MNMDKPRVEEHGMGDWENPSQELLDSMEQIKKDFSVDTAKLKEITNKFEEELQNGLDNHDSNIAMEVTWVRGFPTGKETGSFLTIDLGGTNLRVCWITLPGNGNKATVVQDSYRLPNAIKTGQAEDLWGLVTQFLGDFIEKHKLKSTDGRPLPLGFTFSYPASQDWIDHGTLRTWTKGFAISGVEGKNVASQLREAMEKRKLSVELVALINDTTGALIASAYNDPETIVGAIFGTGCNAAYMENLGSIHKLNVDASKSGLSEDTPMAINCEYGAFDNAHQILPRTKYDIMIDESSPKPGEQAFEKMSAGLYLGEIFRLAVIDLFNKGLIFEGGELGQLRDPYHLDTGFLSALEHESDETIKATFSKDLGITATHNDIRVSRELAIAIATRGARLCTTGIAALCRKKNLSSGHVAADGSVANKHPGFKRRWASALGEILDWPKDRENDPIIITSAEDGSGIGAAVIAAMAVNNFRDTRSLSS